MGDKYFTKVEAEALVGRQIRTLVAWAGVPSHTTGMVVGADESRSGCTVAIQWDLPIEPRSISVGVVGSELVLVITGGHPLVDWFSRSEYEQYLVEV